MTQEPNYLLRGVVRSKDEMEDFSGPLELILVLLSKNKIDIRNIQISLLLDQYLDYLRLMKEMDLEIASEFVQMASHLTYIKTKMLLAEEKEPTELEQLVSALEQLQNQGLLAAVRGVLPSFEEMEDQGIRIQTRGPLPLPDRPYDVRHEPSDLLVSLGGILLSGNPSPAEPNEMLRKAAPKPIIFSVRKKSEQILEKLESRKRIPWRELLGMCASKTELVAAFLSVLELSSLGKVYIAANDGDYEICCNSNC